MYAETRKLFGVPDEIPDVTRSSVWSEGEELYIGSQVSATGKVSGVTGIVPGPPEGSRGSTGWGHLSRRAPWAESGREPALSGLGRPPLGPPPMRLGLGTLGWGAPHLAWGALHPPGRRSLGIFPSPGPVPPLGAYIKEGGGRAAAPCILAPPSPLLHLSLSQKLGEALPETRYIHHHAVVLLDLHQPLLPPCWINKEETSSPTVRVLNAEVLSVQH